MEEVVSLSMGILRVFSCGYQCTKAEKEIDQYCIEGVRQRGKHYTLAVKMEL